MAEEPEELLWEDEDAENEEGVEDLLAEEEGAEEQPEEAPQTAEQEQPQPEERGAQPEAKPDEKPGPSGAEKPQSETSTEPKRRFPPARIKPPDGDKKPNLDKPLGQSKAEGKASGPAESTAAQPSGRKPIQPPPGAQRAGGNKQKIAYFIIRSFNQDNVEIALNKSGWATTNRNEQRLDEVFKTHDEVRLIFAVNGGSSFLGYAVMRTPIGKYPAGQILWSNGRPFGREFGIEWKVWNPLPFERTEHLKNPWNDNKKVMVARDGTELPQELGDKLVQLLEQQARMDRAPPPPKRWPPGSAAGPAGRRPPFPEPRPPPGEPPREPPRRGMGGMHMNGGGGGPMNGMMGAGPGMRDGMMGGGPGMDAHGPGMMNQGMGGGMHGMGSGGGRGRSDGGAGGMGMQGNGRQRSRSPVMRGMGDAHHGGGGGGGGGGIISGIRDRERQRDMDNLMPGANVPDLKSLSYDDYLDRYRRIQQQMDQVGATQRKGGAGGPPAGPIGGSGGGMGGGGPDMLQLQQQKAAQLEQQKLQQQQQQLLQMQQMSLMSGMNPMAAMQGMGMGIPPAMAAGGALGMGMGGGMGGMGRGGMGGMWMGMNPMMAGGGGGMMMPGALGGGGMGGPMGVGMGAGFGGASGNAGMQQNKPLTEEEYIALTVNTFKNQGQQPPDLEFIRQHYRQQKMSLGMM